MPSLACPWCPCRTGNNVVPSVCFVSEGTAVCFPKIHARPLEGIRILHSRNFNTPAMSHAVVKCKLNHKELCELLQVSFIFAFFFFFFLPPVSRGAHSVQPRTTIHHHGVQRFLKAGTLHWVGYSLLCKVLVFKGYPLKPSGQRCNS